MNVRLQGRLPGCLLGLCFCLQTVADPDPKAQITLKSGSELTGNIMTTASPHLQLKPYWSTEALQIPLAEIWRFEHPQASRQVLMDGALLQFRNGDRLQLENLRYDGTNFTGKSSWDEDVILPGGALSHIRFFHKSRMMYSGPDPQVTLGGESRIWQTEDIEWPKKFLMEARLEKSSEDMVYQLTLSADQNRNLARWPGRLVLDFSDKMVSGAWFHLEKQNRLTVKNWREPIPVSDRTDFIQLYGDLGSQSFTLYVNEREVKSWQSASVNDFSLPQLTPVIFALSSNGEMQIPTLRILRWNPKAVMPARDGGTQTTRDRVFLRDGPPQAGKLLRMDERGIEWKDATDPTPRLFEFSDLLMLQLSDAGIPVTSPISPEMVRIRSLGVEDLLHLHLKKIDGGRLYMEGWTGPFSIPLNAVKSFEIPEDQAP
jgi:hypothetical protein